MTEEEFWEIVDSALIDPSTPYFLEDHYLSYWNALAALPDDKLAEFASLQLDIKQRALVSNLPQVPFVVNQGWSDLEFQNLLTGLISRGLKVFGDFLLDPEGTLGAIDRPLLLIKCEAFDYAPLAIQGERKRTCQANDLPDQ
ncbi:DUF4240 domain-containing protein [bacterium]|nr:DUF4240 domain-containing protein [bacterium]